MAAGLPVVSRVYIDATLYQGDGFIRDLFSKWFGSFWWKLFFSYEHLKIKALLSDEFLYQGRRPIQ